MRIIAGKLKGTKLYLPQNKNTRPLKDQTKESIFNLLIHSKKMDFKLEESNILDLYAGTGSFGLECLSRKANSVCFVEKERDAIKILERNIDKLNLRKRVDIFFDDVLSVTKNQKVFKLKFNLIFCDPPFRDSTIGKIVNLIFNNNILKKRGIIIIHRNKKSEDNYPDSFIIFDIRKYGISKIIFGNLIS